MRLFIAFSLTLFSLSSFAAYVHEAKIGPKAKYIILTVAYGGGCKEHSFSIDELICHSNYPAKCEARLIESIKDGPDDCNDMIREQVLIKLKDFNMDPSDFSNGSLKIIGGTPRGETRPTQVKINFPQL